MPIRKTRYGSITLAFVPGIDGHPELLDDAPPPPEPEPVADVDRAPRWSERNLRRLMARDREQGARALKRVSFEMTMRRILRGGV
jgi:hypothetical protein